MGGFGEEGGGEPGKDVLTLGLRAAAPGGGPGGRCGAKHSVPVTGTWWRSDQA
ncbi:hypothetical protein SLNWT_5222 [Streptomyces albus]|uniref:Uncharacterized protein n=1 Tax=Streptomyces albus (strain ATCC 21838 / DSM 41398 / FERM P-419 / JCM 4703 / NBRC 107858) TaxID=1081613 RepID=A0A0B5ES04_STRA4|nr:hypothetical protein SLNWT_5222 [Streptomyces albus]